MEVSARNSVGHGKATHTVFTTKTYVTLGQFDQAKAHFEARKVLWVCILGKFKMAELKLNSRVNPPSLVMLPCLSKLKMDYLKYAEETKDLKEVSEFFEDLNNAVLQLERKYQDENLFRSLEQVIPSRAMIVNILKKIHTKIIRRLKENAKAFKPMERRFYSRHSTRIV